MRKSSSLCNHLCLLSSESEMRTRISSVRSPVYIKLWPIIQNPDKIWTWTVFVEIFSVTSWRVEICEMCEYD